MMSPVKFGKVYQVQGATPEQAYAKLVQFATDKAKSGVDVDGGVVMEQGGLKFQAYTNEGDNALTLFRKISAFIEELAKSGKDKVEMLKAWNENKEVQKAIQELKPLEDAAEIVQA